MTFYGFSALLTSVLTLIVGFFIFTRGVKQTRNILFFLINIAVSIWCFGSYIYATTQNANLIYLYSRLSHFAGTFIPVFFVHLVYDLTGAKSKKRMLPVYYALSAIAALLTLSPAFVSEYVPLFPNYLALPVPGILYGTFVAFFNIAAVYAFSQFIIAYFKVGPVQKNQFMYIMVASLFGLLGTNEFFLTLYLSPLRFPFPHDWLVLVFTLMFAYAILKRKLPDFVIVLKRLCIYAILLASIVGLYSLLMLIARLTFTVGQGIDPMLIALATAVAVTLGFKPFEAFLSDVVNEYFPHRRLEPEQTLRLINEAMIMLTDMNKLVKLTTRIVARKMGLTEASMLVLDEGSRSFVVKAGEANSKGLVGKALPADSELFKHLFNIKKWLSMDEIIDTLDNKATLPEGRRMLNAVRKEMDDLHAQLCLPCLMRSRHMGSKLIAVVCVGEKLSGDDYSKEDLQLLTTLCVNAAIAVENALVFEGISKQLGERKGH